MIKEKLRFHNDVKNDLSNNNLFIHSTLLKTCVFESQQQRDGGISLQDIAQRFMKIIHFLSTLGPNSLSSMRI